VLLFAPIVILVPFALRTMWRRQRAATAFLTANALIVFVLAATWHSWQGGWCWGPRLLMPAVLPLLAVLGPWLDGAAWRPRLAAGLLALGLAISAATLVVPTQAQQLDRPLPNDGPSVLRQYQLIPAKLEYTAHHPFQGASGDHRRYVVLWQVNAMRELGKPGIPLALLGSIALLGAAAMLPRRAMRLAP
jgi:hypothetical protein